MFFIFCSFSSSWKQQKEKGEILITIKYRLISCLVFVTSCKLYTTVNLCYFQEWIMIVTLRARASSIVNFLEHPQRDDFWTTHETFSVWAIQV